MPDNHSREWYEGGRDLLIALKSRTIGGTYRPHISLRMINDDIERFDAQIRTLPPDPPPHCSVCGRAMDGEAGRLQGIKDYMEQQMGTPPQPDWRGLVDRAEKALSDIVSMDPPWGCAGFVDMLLADIRRAKGGE